MPRARFRVGCCIPCYASFHTSTFASSALPTLAGGNPWRGYRGFLRVGVRRRPDAGIAVLVSGVLVLRCSASCRSLLRGLFFQAFHKKCSPQPALAETPFPGNINVIGHTKTSGRPEVFVLASRTPSGCDQGPQNIFLADDADNFAVFHNGQRIILGLDHQAGQVLERGIRAGRDR